MMTKIREGYKETEIGVIPEDWEVINFFETLSDFIDFRGRTPKKLGLDWSDNGIIALSALNVKMGKIDFNIEPKFGSMELYEKWMTRGELKKDDILFTMEAPLGNVALVPDDNKYILSQRVVALKTTNSVDSKYLAYYMMGKEFQLFLNANATGSTAKGISQKNLTNARVAVPTLPEQQRIAEILSTTDTHIEKLDKTIEDYQLLKKGMMKKLLTEGIGHKEFKDSEIGRIPKEWEVCCVDKCTEKIIGGGTPSRSNSEYFNGNIPWVTVKDLDGKFYKDDAKECITEKAIEDSSASLVESFSVIIATRMGLGRGFINTIPVAINQDMKALMLKSELDSRYFLYWYLSKAEYIENLGTGTTVKGIRLETLRELLLPVPSKDEQIAIVSILSIIDKKIELFNSEKSDFKVLKNSLMEKLLTGKVRVI